ncbi:uncharacterized protein LOC134699386 [Mytilus trossulus]|uniref:uncharacterized protein LOC134699386 n=1 Tax=Mytilus trossulus TaxID=6551 RepID=UPI0030058FD5
MDYNITIPEYSQDLSKHMYRLQQSGLFCDAWLVCKDGVVFVHKLVLVACGSAYLLQQLSTDTSSNTQCQVFLKDYSLKTVYDLVQALYTGSFTLNHERAFDLLNLCTFLDVSIFTTSVQGVVNSDANLKQQREERQKSNNRNSIFYDVEIAQDSFSAPLKIPMKLLEDNVILERIEDSTINIKGQSSQPCRAISKRTWTSTLNSDCVDNNKRKTNVDLSNTMTTDSNNTQVQSSQSSGAISMRTLTSILNSNCVDNNKRKNNVDLSNTMTTDSNNTQVQSSQSSLAISMRTLTSILNSNCVDNNKRKTNVDLSKSDSGIPKKLARVSEQSKNDVQTRSEICSQKIKVEKEKPKIVKHTEDKDSPDSTIQSNHTFEVKDKKRVSKKTERLSAISGLIYEADENSSEETITDIDGNSSEATITDIDENSSDGSIIELQLDKSISKGSSEKSKPLPGDNVDSEKSKTLPTTRDSSEKSKTLPTTRDSSEKSKTLSTSMGSSEKQKPLTKSKSISEKSKTLPTCTSKGSLEKSKNLSTSVDSSEISKALTNSMSSSKHSKTLPTNKGQGILVKTERQGWKCQLCQKVSKDFVENEDGQHICTGCDSLFSGEDNQTDGGANQIDGEDNQTDGGANQTEGEDNPTEGEDNPTEGEDNPTEGEDNQTDDQENMGKVSEIKKEKKELHSGKVMQYDYQSLVDAYYAVKEGGMSIQAACKHFCVTKLALQRRVSGKISIDINPHDTLITEGIHRKRNKKYRSYSTSAMATAYKAVVEDKVSMRSASKLHGVPFTTLMDRVNGRIDPDCTTSGNGPFFPIDKESRLVTHLIEMGELGYGYYRQDVVDIAMDYAIALDLKTKKDKPLTLTWYSGMIKRWPDFKIVKLKALEVVKANNANKETISKYFNQLEKALLKYNLIDKPHLIYNVDEKSVAISGKGEIVTILGCGNAAGSALPPFFILPVQKVNEQLLEGSSPGSVVTFSKTGESNSDIFMDFLRNHFMKIVPDNELVLLLLDGHASHIPVSTFEWARNHNIILQLIPALTSHFLQPLDVGCYGLLKDIYNSLCHKTIRTKNCALDHNDVCPMVCKAYKDALSTSNLQSAFRKTGIYPFTKDVMELPLEPSEALCLTDSESIEESQVENVIDLHLLNEDNSLSEAEIVNERNHVTDI